jgi:hypothetical protein
LKRRWTEHIFHRIRVERRPIFVLTYLSSMWQAVRDQIKKHRYAQGRYARFNLAGSAIADGWDEVVLTPAPISDYCAPADEMFETVQAFAISVPFVKRAISTGRRWALPKPPKTGEWERVSRLGGDMSDTTAVLSRLGLLQSYVTRPWGEDQVVEAVEWNVPPHWLGTDAYADHLTWLELGEVADEVPDSFSMNCAPS